MAAKFTIKERFKRWWQWHFDSKWGGGFAYKLKSWCREKGLRWLTPWLANARVLMDRIVNPNDTKLLEWEPFSFGIRTRNENQFYFWGELSLLGRLKVWKNQYIGTDGTAKNLLVSGLLGDETLETRSELLFDGRVLTWKQCSAAFDALLKFEEFTWDPVGTALYRLAYAVRPKDIGKFFKIIRNSVMARLFPGVAHSWDLQGDDHHSYEKAVAEVTPNEAKILWENRKEK